MSLTLPSVLSLCLQHRMVVLNRISYTVYSKKNVIVEILFYRSQAYKTLYFCNILPLDILYNILPYTIDMYYKVSLPNRYSILSSRSNLHIDNGELKVKLMAYKAFYKLFQQTYKGRSVNQSVRTIKIIPIWHTNDITT